MPRHLHPLLPAKPKSWDSPTVESRGDELRPLKRKRSAVTVACTRCRRKKVSCDGQRPSCARCLESELGCDYVARGSPAIKEQLTQVQKDLANHEDVLQHLRSAPEEEALSVVRSLRTTRDVGVVLSCIRNTFSPKPPSVLRLARATLPPTPAIEFELTVQHSLVYPVIEPMDLLIPDLDVLGEQRPDVLTVPPTTTAMADLGLPSEDSMGHGTVSPYLLSAGSESYFSDLWGDTSTPTSLSSYGPSQPPRYCDSRLNQLDVQFWTKVSISNELAASAISRYLETDHVIFGFFDADIFLSDLVGHRLQHCSPFLVSSLLCLACLCYDVIDNSSAALSLVFLRETEELLPSYHNSASTTTLSALMILAVASSWHGRDELCLDMFAKGRAMAEQLKLFGHPSTPSLVAEFSHLSTENFKAASHSAWGSYGIVTLHCTFFNAKCIEYQPVLPIPGDMRRAKDSSGETIWPDHSLPEYVGHTFTAICQLWKIAQEVVALYNSSSDRPISERVPLSFAEEKYQKMLSWADTLTHELARNENSRAHVYLFHMLYHITVLNIFRPLLDPVGGPLLRSFRAFDSSPNAIFEASSKQLERLLVHASKLDNTGYYSAIFNVAVMHVSNLVLDNTDRKDWRYYFLLCMNYWIGTVPTYPVVVDIAQGYLSMAVQNGCLSPQEAKRWRSRITERNRHHEISEIACSVIVDFNLATKSTCDIRAHELSQQFDELVMFEELTNREVLNS